MGDRGKWDHGLRHFLVGGYYSSGESYFQLVAYDLKIKKKYRSIHLLRDATSYNPK